MAVLRLAQLVLLVICGTVVVNGQDNYDFGFRRPFYDDYVDLDQAKEKDFIPSPAPNERSWLNVYYADWDSMKRNDFVSTPGPRNRFDNYYLDQNGRSRNDLMPARDVRIIVPPEMQAAMYGALCLSLILSLVLIAVLLKNICALLSAACKWCSPRSRVLLKPNMLLSHDENIRKKMSLPENQDLIGRNAPNDRTQLKNDFVTYYT